ncbi:MAG: hypothetical protein ACTSVE_03855 [Candidatus Helarchaeota archaeon]
MVIVELGNELPSPEQICVEIGENGIKLNALLEKYPPKQRGTVVYYLIELINNDNLKNISINDLKAKSVDSIYLILSEKGKTFYKQSLRKYVKYYSELSY